MCTEIPGFSLATVDQLAIAAGDFLTNGEPLCPMLIWAQRNGMPVLVRVDPSSSSPIVEINEKISHKCLAYSVCSRVLVP